MPNESERRLTNVRNRRAYIYSPVALWKDHHPQVVELAWRESQEGSEVWMIHCNYAFSSCPANRFNEQLLCSNCVYQSKYTSKNLLPKGTRNVWYPPTRTVQVDIPIKQVSIMSELLSFQFEGVNLGFGVASHLVSKYQDIYIPTNILETEGNSLLLDAINFFKFSKRLFGDSNGDDRVYIWGGRRHTEAPMALAAENLGLKVFSFEIGEGGRGKIHISENKPYTLAGFRSDVTSWIENQIRAQGEANVIANGENFIRASISGTLNRHDMPHFMKESIKDADLFHKLTLESKRIVTFFTSSLWEYVMYTDWKEKNDFWDLYTSLENFIRNSVSNGDLYVVRWHPNLVHAGQGERKRVSEAIKKLPKVIHIEPESRIDSYKLIDLSDVVVTPGSTVGLEAAHKRKTVITIGNTTYNHLDFSYVASNSEELEKLLRMDLEPRSPKSAYFYAAYLAARGEPYNYVALRDDGYEINGLKIEKKSVPRRLRELKYKVLAILQSIRQK